MSKQSPSPAMGREVSDNKGAEQGYDGHCIRPIGPVWESPGTTFDQQVVRKTHARSRVDAQGTEWWWDPDKGGWSR